MKIEQHREEFSAAGLRFAIVVSRWNDAFTSKLEAGAREALTSSGAENGAVEVFRVPGAFELPAAGLKAAMCGDFDAVIALGVVLRGDTPHFDYVAGQAAAGIMQASLQSGVPITFGVITADTFEQVVERTRDKFDNKGYEAALSAIEMAYLFREMGGRSKERVFPHVV